MNNKILTPMQLWSDYNPEDGQLQTSFKKYEDRGQYFYFEGYCNGEQYSDGNTRIFFRGMLPKTHINKVLLFINDTNGAEYNNIDMFVNQGFCTITFDYIGKPLDENLQNYTLYPQSITYANFYSKEARLNKVVTNAKETNIHIWSQVCRRMITFAQQLLGDNSKVYLVGVKNGAEIMWQVGAMDKRVAGLISILNIGWNKIDFHNIDEQNQEEMEKWITGCTCQNYIKFVECPTLFVVSTNGKDANIDRLGETITNIDANVTIYISANLSNSIDTNGIKLVEKWIENLKEEKALPKSPNVQLLIDNGRVGLSVQADDSEKIIEKGIVYASYCNDCENRCWHKILQKNNEVINIPIFHKEQKILAYAYAIYRQGYGICSNIETFSMTENVEIQPIHHKQVILDKYVIYDSWVVENDEPYDYTRKPQFKQGLNDISGLTANTGNLISYILGEEEYQGQENAILLADFCSKVTREVVVELQAMENGILNKYYYKREICANKWTKFSMEVNEFKTIERLPLKSWKNVKKITIEDIDGLLVNNILWV